MFDTRETQRTVGRVAWIMAWFGLVAGQFHAMARHNTVDGKGDLQQWSTRVWSDPARHALKPLLDWGNPDLVYLTYGKVWLPVFLAFTACAFVVRRRRQPAGFEKWAWRVALTGYVWAVLAVIGNYWLQWGAHTNESLLNVTFLLGLPGLLIMMAGSTMLGIALLRNGVTPRLAGWLLALTIPFVIALMFITSMGNAALPAMFAFALLGRRISTEADRVQVRRVTSAV